MKNSLTAGVLLLLFASLAGGGQIVTPWHQLDPEESAIDVEPPGVPGLSLLGIQRGLLPRHAADGSPIATDMDDFGYIRLLVEPPADDRTEPGRIGYLLYRIDGALPENMSLFASGMRAIRQPAAIYGLEAEADSVSVLQLHWYDGVKVRQDKFDFRICIRAQDLAGNLSEPSDTLRVRHDGSVPRH